MHLTSSLQSIFWLLKCCLGNPHSLTEMSPHQVAFHNQSATTFSPPFFFSLNYLFVKITYLAADYVLATTAAAAAREN